MGVRRTAGAKPALRAWSIAVALVIAVGLLACATNPVTGRSEVSLLSTADEIAMGRRGAAEVESEMGLVDDPQLASYVSALGERLARYSPRSEVGYRFAVVDMAEPNAFALPGGWIYVSRGLLAITNDEAELAGVLGHEIGHVAARHAAQRHARQAGATGGALLSAALGGLLGGAQGAAAGASLAQAAGAGWIASYGRDQERQADDVGQALSARAGYDPAGISEFLATLERESQLRSEGAPRQPSFLDSHPLTAERVANTRARAAQTPFEPAVPLALRREDFLALLEGLVVGPDPRAGVFEGALFRHPGLDFAIEVPSGWATHNAPDAVIAQAPGGGAAWMLELQGEARSPRDAARDFAAGTGLRLDELRDARVGGAPALRATAFTPDGRNQVDLTWISHAGVMLRATGVTTPELMPQARPLFAATSQSFRRLRDAERRELVPQLLHLVKARPGESLSSLGSRTGNRWSVAETAVANGVGPGHVYRGGETVKIVRPGAGG